VIEMASSQMNRVIDQLRQMIPPTDSEGPSDGQLLDRLVAGRDEAAFTAIVRRHGPMVLGVCQRVAGNLHDAEDAFQATFLVLAKKADTLSRRDLVANWLYGVARRISMKFRGVACRRRLREQAIDDIAELPIGAADEWDDLRAVLDEEIGRLPERYRSPVILCELQCQSRREVARQLAIPEGTLSSRLASARRILARRLAGRGISLSLTSLLAVLCEGAAGAVVRSSLVRSTVIAAVGDVPEGRVPSRVAALAQGAMHSMYFTRLKFAAMVFVALAVSGGVAGILAARAETPGTRDKPKPPATPASDAKAEAPAAKWENLLAKIDPDRHTVGKGIWRLKDGKLTAYPAAHGARLRIPIVPSGNYELRARWEPKDGDSTAAFIVPHGDRMASFELMPRFGCAGLGDLNGVRPDINETKKELTIKPGKIYDVYIRMSTNGGTIHVLAKLDEQTIVDWEGKRSEVDHEFFAPPKPASLGLGVGGHVSIFHSLELRMLTGTADAWKDASPVEKN
jgi:RNA polymerase sigma factor (sigma-70 family)